jgi:xanthine dehydrogenase molybdenum-binding subunit
MGKATDPEFVFGNVEEGLKKGTPRSRRNLRHAQHQPPVSRNAHRDGLLAERQGLRPLLTQSTAQTVPALARWLQIDPNNVVVISEYTGGGFGSKITSAISAIIPAIMSKKVGAPVMMRISREEEHFIGRARPSLHGRLKVGFTKEGKITAIDGFVVMDNGPYDPQGDGPTSGRMISLMYQPRPSAGAASRSSPTRRRASRRASPAAIQGIALMEPILSKASRKLGIDQVALHRLNCPEGKAQMGPAGQSRQARLHHRHLY